MSFVTIVYEVLVDGDSFALYNERGRADSSADALRRAGKQVEVRERRVV